MKFDLKPLMLSIALSSLLIGSALDLPVKRIQGRDYYIYNVQRGEDLYSIADKLGITRNDIIKFNPGASEGVKAGLNLYLPVSEFEEKDPNTNGISATSDGATLRYKVQKGETLFGIAYKFGVTADEIAELNPAAKAGVRSGMMLNIPIQDNGTASATEVASVPEPEEEETTVDVPVLPEQEARLRPVDRPVRIAVPEEDSISVDVPELPEQEARLRPVNPGVVLVDTIGEEQEIEPSTVTLLLPLMINQPSGEQTRVRRSATDFARGFIMGLETESSLRYPVRVRIADTEGSADRLQSMLASDSITESDVIIAPENLGSLAEILSAADAAEAYVLNLFAVADTSYITHPLVLQANIPATLMYEKAAETLMASYSEHLPVFLISKGGKGEKLPFTNYLRQQYADNGIEPMDLVYDGMLTSADIQNLDPAGQYVFIPASGSLSEFSKFARTLATLREDAADPTSIVIWGYPDWTAFRGDNLAMLHKLGATIYSRFYCDAASSEARDFERRFRAIYGVEPADLVPSQAMMGYDAARYLIRNINENEGSFIPEQQPLFRGLQNSFLFHADSDDPENHEGPVNGALYIVTFLPGDGVTVSVI